MSSTVWWGPRTKPDHEPWEEDTVTSHNVWDKIRHFDDMESDKQQGVYNYILKDDSWHSRYYLSDLIGKSVFTADQKFALFNKYLDHGGYDNDDGSIFDQMLEVDKDKTRDALRERKDCAMSRRLVTFDAVTESDEIMSLRAISKSKYAPQYIYAKKYAPSFDAIKKLPPIMRLKSLEALTSNIHISYNLFEKITDADEFKRLLFSSVIRYRDRAEAVWEKYNELRSLGIEGTVLVKMHCDNCGDYELTLTSNVVRTKSKLSATSFGEFINRSSCLLCGKWGKHLPSISGDIEGLNGQEDS